MTPHANLVCVLVLLRGAGKDEFYTLKFKDLQKHFAAAYKGGRRPKSPDSTHCAIWPKELQSFLGWQVLLDVLSLADETSNRTPRLRSARLGRTVGRRDLSRR